MAGMQHSTQHRCSNIIEQHSSLDETTKQEFGTKKPIRAASSPLPPVKVINATRSSFKQSNMPPRSPTDRNFRMSQNKIIAPYEISPICADIHKNLRISTTSTEKYTDESTSNSSSTYRTPPSGTYSPQTAASLESCTSSPDYIISDFSQCSSPHHKSPRAPNKFVFDPISPIHTRESSVYKKFEYYEPISPDDLTVSSPPKSPNYLGLPQKSNEKTHSHLSGYSKFKMEWEMPSLSSNNISSQQPENYKSTKRDSCLTESTHISMDSNGTNVTNSATMTSTTSFSHSETESNTENIQTAQKDSVNFYIDRDKSRQRRLAINITPNPGYQAIHASHSTLDRTCSDSVVSLFHRRSTSDLTSEVDVNSKNRTISSQKSYGQKTHGRGSSKGGLAYLANRRSSRDSMKSAYSNTSVFSNDDIGPLAFQASSRGKQRRTSNFLELPVPDHIRPRVCSLPDRTYNPRVSEDLYRLRHFSISKGNVVNCGDSIISRRSKSNNSVNSTNSRASERSPFDGSCCGGGYANVDSVVASSDESENVDSCPPQRYRIVMLGGSDVGKTALVNQFMTSEYMHTYDASLDDEFGEKTVSVLLDGEESELIFVDHPSIEMSVENCLATYEPHGCVIVFSVIDRSSFCTAEEIINYLWQENYSKDKAVILVGNKADLARSRVITTSEGKNLAGSRDAKFIETSSGIQHNVDELLVGILKQMRLKETREKKAVSSKLKSSRTHISLHLAKEILQKICLTDISKSKSCENLHVL